MSSQAQRLTTLADDSTAAIGARERSKLLAFIANEPFSSETHTVAKWTKIGFDVVGFAHPSKPGEVLASETVLTSLEWHCVKHTANGTLQVGTMANEYMADVRSAVVCTTAVLHVGRDETEEGSRARAGVTADPTTMTPPLKRVIARPGRYLLTIYDPSRRRLVSSYGISASELPRRIGRWQNYRTL